jgi:magnesium transporter
MTEDQDKYDNLLEQLQELPEEKAPPALREEINRLHPSEIADLLESLPGKQRDNVWDLIDPELEGDVLVHVQDAVRSGRLEQMAPEKLAEVAEALDTDDAVDLLQDLPEPMVDEVLQSMDAQNRARLATVLSYPEDTAGGLMNVDAITVRAEVELDVVLRYLRVRGELPEKTDNLIVVDRNNSYLGMLPLENILTQPPERTVGEVMIDVEPITVDRPAREVAIMFEQRDLLSAPVVDAAGSLLGRITVDDVVDVIVDRGDQSLMSMAGLDPSDDLFEPVLESARRRAIWLGVNLATAFVAAWVIGRFEATISQLVALAILMPVVASMGGIAGSQTLTLVIRGLALGHVSFANARSLLYKELSVSIINACIWALVVGCIAYFWFDNAPLGVVLGMAMIVNLLTAALSGLAIPLVLKQLQIDPALAGGVVLTTVTDVVGFTAFLGLATIFLV